MSTSGKYCFQTFKGVGILATSDPFRIFGPKAGTAGMRLMAIIEVFPAYMSLVELAFTIHQD